LYIGLSAAGGAVTLALVIALIVMSVKMLTGAFQEPSKALSVYTDALIRKDYQGAYNMTSTGFHTSSSLDDVVKFHENVTNQIGALKSVKQTYWHIDTRNGENSSTIQAEMQFEHGSRIFEFDLVEEKGTWRVFRYHAVTPAAAGVN
jgi:hypothetical protein